MQRARRFTTANVPASSVDTVKMHPRSAGDRRLTWLGETNVEVEVRVNFIMRMRVTVVLMVLVMIIARVAEVVSPFRN